MMRVATTRRLVAGVSIAAILIAGACGDSDEAATGDDRGNRVVEIEMVDIAFKPSTIEVAKGEEVTFRFTNKGKLPHDAFIGDAEAQAEHEQEMTANEDGDDHGSHGDGDAITVAPGKSETLTYTFDEVGTIEIGCHQPGHYAAGMKVEVTVE